MRPPYAVKKGFRPPVERMIWNKVIVSVAVSFYDKVNTIVLSLCSLCAVNE